MKKTFADIKKSTMSFEKLSEKAAKAETKVSYKDDRFWQATPDKAGNAEAVIRFLPQADMDELPWIKYFSHFFKGENGKYYTHNCPTTLGKDCPCCDDNGVLWNQGESGQKIVRDRRSKRNLHYVANVLVVDDKANPENNGKVFLFKYGQKIQEKVMDALNPKFDSDEPFNPFDLVDGCNFKLRMIKKDGFANFDKSDWARQSLADVPDDAEIYSLAEFVAPEAFKDYDILKNDLNKVLGVSKQQVTETIADVDDDLDDEISFSIDISGAGESVNTVDDDEDVTAIFNRIQEKEY